MLIPLDIEHVWKPRVLQEGACVEGWGAERLAQLSGETNVEGGARRAGSRSDGDGARFVSSRYRIITKCMRMATRTELLPPVSIGWFPWSLRGGRAAGGRMMGGEAFGLRWLGSKSQPTACYWRSFGQTDSHFLCVRDVLCQVVWGESVS